MKHCFNGITFRLMEVEVISYVSLGNDEGVMLSDRESIPDGKAKFILRDDTPSA